MRPDDGAAIEASARDGHARESDTDGGAVMSTRRRPALSGAVLIADDHEVTRFGMTQLVLGLGAERVLEAEDFDRATELFADEEVALAIFDLDMPGLSGPADLAQLRRQRPEVKLVVLSGSTRRSDILASLASGAHGYFVKTEPLAQMVQRLQRVLLGEIYVPPILAELGDDEEATAPRATHATPSIIENFTPRQRRVLQCLEQGMTNKEIGRELSITVRTVKMHLASIYPALGVHNRTQAVAAIRDLGGMGPDSGSSDGAAR